MDTPELLGAPDVPVHEQRLNKARKLVAAMPDDLSVSLRQGIGEIMTDVFGQPTDLLSTDGTASQIPEVRATSGQVDYYDRRFREILALDALNPHDLLNARRPLMYGEVDPTLHIDPVKDITAARPDALEGVVSQGVGEVVNTVLRQQTYMVGPDSQDPELRVNPNQLRYYNRRFQELHNLGVFNYDNSDNVHKPLIYGEVDPNNLNKYL